MDFSSNEQDRSSFSPELHNDQPFNPKIINETVGGDVVTQKSTGRKRRSTTQQTCALDKADANVGKRSRIKTKQFDFEFSGNEEQLLIQQVRGCCVRLNSCCLTHPPVLPRTTCSSMYVLHTALFITLY